MNIKEMVNNILNIDEYKEILICIVDIVINTLKISQL